MTVGAARGEPERSVAYGEELLARYRDHGDPADLRRAQAAYQAAADAPSAGSGDRLAALDGLGEVGWQLYRAGDDVAELDEAVARFDEALRATPPDSPGRSMRLANLATSLLARFHNTGDADWLDRTVAAARQAVTPVAFDHVSEGGEADQAEQARQWSVLGQAVYAQYQRSNELRDLDEAIDAFRTAVAPAPPGLSLAGWRYNLAQGLLERFEQLGDRADLHDAVAMFVDVVESVAPTAPARAIFLSGLGSALDVRYGVDGQEADLDRAIEALEECVALTPPPDDPSGVFLLLAMRQHSLGTVRHERYRAHGDPRDLAAALRALEAAVVATPDGTPALARHLASLANAWFAEYGTTGDVDRLDKAVLACQRALSLVSPTAGARATYLDNLAAALLARHERTGSIDDLNESVQLSDQAVEATREQAVAAAGMLNNLGNRLRIRYEYTRDRVDLDKAIDAFERAVEQTNPASPDYATYLDNLGNGLSDRYTVSRDRADLELAIARYREAVDELQADSPERPRCLTNLGTALLDWYLDTGDADALDRAVAIFSDVSAETPPASPYLPMRLNNLGISLKHRYQRDGRPGDREGGVEALRRATTIGATADLRWAVRAAAAWGAWEAREHRWAEASEAYRMALAADVQRVEGQLCRDSTETALRQAAALYQDAGYVHTRAGRPTDAVAALEQGRAVLLRRVLDRENADLHGLIAHGRRDLADRFRRARDRLTVLVAP